VPGQIVFLSLFLGIVAGKNPVNLQVTGPVKSIRIFVGDRQAAVLNEPPWRATVDFGPELTPRELTAVGFDAGGNEIARATQVLNLPRPLAEFDIVVEHGRVSLPSRHLMGLKPTRAKVAVDGKPLAVDAKLRGNLPRLSLDQPHVISAEVRFEDGFVARKERVLQAETEMSDAVGTELTAIGVRETSAQHPPSWEGCLAAPNGKPVRTAAVEDARALLIVVREPSAKETTEISNADLARPMGRVMLLDKETMLRMMWPLGESYGHDADAKSVLFPPSKDYDGAQYGFLRFLNLAGPVTTDNEALRFADAVAVAGIRAVTGAQRRAVVLILSHKPDTSRHSPQVVRRYLAALGVPLFVWSPVSEPSPDAAAWGDVVDVSSLTKLDEALQRVRHALAEQRVAWVDVDPLTALRLKANPNCGIETIAGAP
jgi:hypothetical protein